MEEFGITLAVLFWLVLIWLGFAFVAMPLLLLSVSVGLLYGTALTVIGYVRIYLGSEDERILAWPDDQLPRWRCAPYPRWDGAWPSYLSWQLERDLLAAIAWPARQTSQLWATGTRQARENALQLVAVLPVVPAPVGFLLGATIGTFAGWAVLAAVIESVMAIPRGVRLAAIYALRATDTSVRWWHGAAATCPNCRYVAWFPAYRCNNDDCRMLHRDLRPGRLGVWRRQCQCGKHLPTTVLRAARSALKPRCVNCGELLHPQAGVISDARIVLSGGPAAGKTQLLIRAAAEMTRLNSSSSWGPADEHASAWLRFTQEGGEGGAGADRGKDPELLTLSRTAEGGECYVHIADVPGGHFEMSEPDAALWQLSTTRRHLIVIDATVLPRVRDRVGQPSGNTGRRAADPAWCDTGVVMAELPYRLLVAQLRRLGARPRRCSLALVVAKTDLLAAHDLALSGTERPSADRLSDWLRSVELHHLVAAAEHDFGRVRCFLVGGAGPESAAPFEWLLKQYPRGAAIP